MDGGILMLHIHLHHSMVVFKSFEGEDCLKRLHLIYQQLIKLKYPEIYIQWLVVGGVNGVIDISGTCFEYLLIVEQIKRLPLIRGLN